MKFPKKEIALMILARFILTMTMIKITMKRINIDIYL